MNPVSVGHVDRHCARARAESPSCATRSSKDRVATTMLSTRGAVWAGRATEVEVDRLDFRPYLSIGRSCGDGMSFQASASFPPVMRAVHVPCDLVALLVFGS
jgi:hypothetical protein